MIAKVAGCLAALCLSTSAAPPPPTETNFPLVHQVVCAEGKGTAFRVGRNTFLSVAHVASLTGCTIDGAPFTATLDGPRDFAILDVPINRGGALKINCDGFTPGEWYFAIGFAKGLPVQALVTVLATYAKLPNGMRVLIGSPTFIPGMSGGPVLNSRGEVVGTVNAYNRIYPLSFSRALRDTEACDHAQP